jgi:hypothetical protein
LSGIGLRCVGRINIAKADPLILTRRCPGRRRDLA